MAPWVELKGDLVALTFNVEGKHPTEVRITRESAGEMMGKLQLLPGVVPVQRVKNPMPQAPPKGDPKPAPWARIESKLGSVYVQTRHIESVVDGGAGEVHVRMLGGNIHVVEGTTADQFMQELFKGVQP